MTHRRPKPDRKRKDGKNFVKILCHIGESKRVVTRRVLSLKKLATHPRYFLPESLQIRRTPQKVDRSRIIIPPHKNERWLNTMLNWSRVTTLSHRDWFWWDNLNNSEGSWLGKKCQLPISSLRESSRLVSQDRTVVGKTRTYHGVIVTRIHSFRWNCHREDSKNEKSSTAQVS